MDATLKHRLLRYLSATRSRSGFTLLELLVTVLIVGILSAVAVPNFLGQVGKARQAEGEIAIGTYFRAQRAYLVERGGFAFPGANDLPTTTLATSNALGIILDLEVYDSGTIDTRDTGDETTMTLGNEAIAISKGVRILQGELEFEDGNFLEVICQSDDPTDPRTPSADPSTDSGIPQCTNGETIDGTASQS